MGPEGGDAGGLLVAEGPPEEVRLHPTSHTGKALRDYAESYEVSWASGLVAAEMARVVKSLALRAANLPGASYVRPKSLPGKLTAPNAGVGAGA